SGCPRIQTTAGSASKRRRRRTTLAEPHRAPVEAEPHHAPVEAEPHHAPVGPRGDERTAAFEATFGRVQNCRAAACGNAQQQQGEDEPGRGSINASDAYYSRRLRAPSR